MSALPGHRVHAAHASIADRAGPPPDAAIILGSGLGQLADDVIGPTHIPYTDIDGFPYSTAPGHAGQFVLGELAGVRVVLMQGRVHLYEGWTAQEVALPVYLMARLGARRLIVTNAAGALNPHFAPGDAMLIDDHLNLTGANPLTGPHDPSLGLRFPDLSTAYCPDLRAAAVAAAEGAGIELKRGVYVGVHGPSLETSAERRFFRASGADAVGMSTVLEVIAAVHAGLPVLGLSAITNAASGGPDQQADTIEAVLANAAIAGVRIAALIDLLLPSIANHPGPVRPT